MRPSTASVGGRHTCFTEPENTIFMYPLQPLTSETLQYATANYEDGARVDVYALGFRGDKHQKAFFDVKVFNPNAPSYCGTQVAILTLLMF